MKTAQQQDPELRAEYLQLQIDEADKRLEKDRKQLRNTYLRKKKLIEDLKNMKDQLQE